MQTNHLNFSIRPYRSRLIKSFAFLGAGLGLIISTNALAISNGTYQIAAKHSGKCLDVSEVSYDNGAKVHQWACHEGSNQKWHVTQMGNAYQIQAVHSEKCLDVTDVSYEKGAMMQQWSCSNGTNQRFLIDQQSDGYYRITAVHSDKVIEIGASSTANGANVKQWDWWGGDSQRFEFRSGSNGATPVWSENFNSIGSGSRWLNRQYTEVRDGCGTNGSKCVRVTYHPSSEGSPRTVANVALPSAKEYTLNYDVMFENGWEFVRGGKLPGLGPNNDTAGCNPISPSGWSGRVMWRPGGTPVIYSYHQDRANRCGDDIYSNRTFSVGQYQAISLHVKVNDPGQYNGNMTLYLNGERIASQENVRLRQDGGSHTQITQFLFHTFFGGSDWSWAPSKTVYSRFDNFAVYPGLRVRQSPGQ
ncbi:Extracellular exo-alpha-L-arabinofuranosidase [Thalassocella blandensis]|nr:Extracellular exo-alpha-L-arabinofuranosidase [Thalassocella blandensis]